VIISLTNIAEKQTIYIGLQRIGTKTNRDKTFRDKPRSENFKPSGTDTYRLHTLIMSGRNQGSKVKRDFIALAHHWKKRMVLLYILV
jgi:hypothetical protein